jgi:hypothetical protein
MPWRSRWPPHPPAGTFSPRGEGMLPQRLRFASPLGERSAEQSGGGVRGRLVLTPEVAPISLPRTLSG